MDRLKRLNHMPCTPLQFVSRRVEKDQVKMPEMPKMFFVALKSLQTAQKAIFFAISLPTNSAINLKYNCTGSLVSQTTFFGFREVEPRSRSNEAHSAKVSKKISNVY